MKSTQVQNTSKSHRKPRQQTIWSYISNYFVNYFSRSFKKEPKLDEFEIMLNEICNMRLAQQYGPNSSFQRNKHELEQLCKVTNFDRYELKLLYWGWKGVCPNGILNEKVIKDIYAQFFPQGESGLYAHYVFNAMFRDKIKNNSGQISFTDYACALSNLCRGNVTQKIQWIFNLYDINGDGRVTLDEMVQISMAIYALLGCHVSPAHDNKTYQEHASKVFAKLDTNNKGYFTFEQFLEKCSQDENIVKSMQLLETTGLQ